MRALLAIAAALALTACRTSSLGACAADSDCPTGTTCDPANKVCAIPKGVCFPACDGSHVCDPATVACVPVQVPEVTVTSPADGASVTGSTLAATATAHAPGCVSAVRFELRSTAGALLAAADGAAGSDGVTWTASLDVSAVPAGAASLTAVATWAQGAVTSAAVGLTLVDADAPQITAVTYAPAPQSDPAGNLFFGTGGDISVQATIADRSGVDPASVCLRVSGETGACAHPGTAGAAGAWTFSLPRAAPPQDGTAPFTFAVEAADTQGNPAHLDQTLFFDYTGPTVAVTVDATPYARTAALISVDALITDPAGVPDGGVFLNDTVAPVARDGGLFTFQLDPQGAPAGSEGPLGFHVGAADSLGNTAQSNGVRTVDDAPPALSIQIYKDAPDGGGVTYPAAVPNTGWTGGTFIYSDTVHVSGTLTDVSGVGTTVFHLDGVGLDGGTSPGTARSIDCGGAASCPFSFDVQLNDAGTVFHSGAQTLDAGIAVGFIPAAALHFTVDAQDDAASFGGAPAAHKKSSATPAQATRLLWLQTLPGAAVSGLAVHPDGDLIATLDGGTGDTVYDLAPDQPAVRWSYGADAGIAAGARPVGAVIGTPAIGAGGASARVYVASAGGNLYAIEADGGTAWINDTAATLFAVGPAIAQVTIAAATVDQVVVPDGVGGGNSKLWRGTSATDVSSVTSNNRDFHAAPLILNGSVFFATQNAAGNTTHLTRHSIAANGALGAASTATANGGSPYFGLITDGTSLFATTRATANGFLQKLDTNFAAAWTTTLAGSGFAGEPTLGIESPGRLYAPDLGNGLSTYDPATGTAAAFVTLAGVPLTPLQGSDGHVYVPRKTGFLAAYAGNALSWNFDPPTAVLRQAMMDCKGRLFVASGPVIYAFVSDDSGLADTPWPSLRRDARNTGNAGALKYGIRTTTGCTQ
jgi:Big-like domain-containing protein